MSDVFSAERQGKIFKVVSPIEGITLNYIDNDDEPWDWLELKPGEIVIDTGLRLNETCHDHLCFTSKGFLLIEELDFENPYNFLVEIDPKPKKKRKIKKK